MRLRVLNWQLSVERVFYAEHTLSGMYNRAAARWDAAIARMGYPAAYERLFARLTANGVLTTLPHDGLVLDAGIGTGALSAALAAHAPTVRIVGVDLSAEMLALAHQRVAALVDLQQVGITRLPFPDAHFDFVMTAHVLEHLPDALEGIAELLRVLKPGRPFLLLVTWPCPMTRLLSLRWNFAAIPERTMRRYIEAAGIPTVAVSPLTQPLRAAYMSRIYVGRKPESCRA
jgi:demethylmenaquinone methyltransferase/2-methoxy-6-polyprenyl-1,4-benzoquinol methylase